MSSPYPMFGSQDLKDDDGQVIDSLLIETNAPPNPADAPEPILIPAPPERPTYTRLFSRELIILPEWAPTLLLPADAKRKSIEFRIYSPSGVTTDGVRFSDEQSTCITAGKILASQGSQSLPHTGAVWVLACGNTPTGVASAPVAIQVYAVTE